MGKPLGKKCYTKGKCAKGFCIPRLSLGFIILHPIQERMAPSYGSGLRLHINYMEILTDHTDFPVIVSAVAF